MRTEPSGRIVAAEDVFTSSTRFFVSFLEQMIHYIFISIDKPTATFLHRDSGVRSMFSHFGHDD